MANFDEAYVTSVFDPDSGPARIPESFGRPTCLFSHKFNGSLSASGTFGNILVFFNPAHAIQPTTSKILQQFVDGTANLSVDTPASNGFSTLGIGTNISAQDYSGKFSHVRLVSAVLKITYFGRQDERAGFISAGLMSNDLSYTTGGTSLLSQIQEGYFHYSGPAENGLIVKYMPWSRDMIKMETANANMDTELGQIAWWIAAVGLKTATILFRYELTVNMEGIPLPAFVDYVHAERNITDLGEESYEALNKLSHLYPRLLVSSTLDEEDIHKVLNRAKESKKRSHKASGGLPGFK